MSRQATDNLYIELDYFTPEEYYTYEAVAASAVTSTTSLSCNGGKLLITEAAVSANFTPTLIVEVTKNSFAILDTISTVSVIPSVNRSIDIALDTIGSLNAMNDRIVGISSALSSTASISTISGFSKSATSSLSTVSSLSADALNLQFAAASLSSTANFSIKTFVSGEKPWLFKTAIVTSISTAQKKFGAASARGTGSAGEIQYYASDDINADGFAIEFWIYPTATLTSKNLFVYAAGSDVVSINTNASGDIRTTIRGIGTLTATGITLSNNSWQHIAVAVNTGTDKVAIWKDGTRVAYVDSNNSFSFLAGAKTGYIYTGDRYIDEVHVRSGSGTYLTTIGRNPDSTTITVPSAEFAADESTMLLAHYNTNFDSDSNLTKPGAAALTTSATLSAEAATLPTQGASSLTCSSSLALTITRLLSFNSNVTATATLTSTVERIQSAALTVDSNFALTSIVGNIKQFAIDCDALFTPSISAEAQLAGVALLESTASVSISAVKTVDALATLTSTASIESIATTTTGFASTLTTTATLNADNIRIRLIDSSLSSSLALSAAVDKIKLADSTVSSAFTQTVSVDKILSTSITTASAFTQTASVERLRSGVAAFSATATFSATVERIQSADSTLSSVATQTTVAVKTIEALSAISAATAINAVAVKTVDAQPQLESIATQLTAVVKNATGTITLESTASLTALTGVIKPFIGANSPLGIRGFTENALDDGGYLKYTGATSGVANTAVFSWWMARPVGMIFDGQPNRNNPLTPPLMNASTLRVEGGLLSFNSGGGGFSSDGGSVAWNIGSEIQNTNVYHHYLLVIDLTKSTNNEKYRLYLDDVFVGIHSVQFRSGAELFPASGPYNLPLEVDTQYNLMMNTGFDGTTIRADEFCDGFGNPHSSLHQFYWDWGNTYPIDDAEYRSKFYQDGWRDLGLTGTATGLAQPKHYIRLNDYVDIADTGTEQTSGTWRELTFFEDVIDNSYDRWLGNTYIPSIEDNSDALLGNNILGRFYLSAEPQVALVFVANLSAQFAVNITAIKQVAAAAAVSAEFTTSITINAFTGILADFSSQATLTAGVVRIHPGSAALACTAALTAITGYERQFASLEMSAATLTCEVTAILAVQFAAALTSTSALTTSITVLTGIGSTMETAVTLTADVTVKPPIRATADLTVISTLSAVIGSIEQFAVLQMSAAVISVTAIRVRTTAIAVNSSFSQNTNINKIVGFSINLSAFNTVLTLGDVINLDPYYQITVPQETRKEPVTAENRIYLIDAESRILTV